MCWRKDGVGGVHMSLMVMVVGELGGWGFTLWGHGVKTDKWLWRCLPGRDLTLTASQPELSDEV